MTSPRDSRIAAAGDASQQAHNLANTMINAREQALEISRLLIFVIGENPSTRTARQCDEISVHLNAKMTSLVRDATALAIELEHYKRLL